MTSAGVLFPEIRTKVEKVFKAPLFNNYGSRETGGIACNCEKNEGLHLVPDVQYVEALDDNSREVNLGESGEIVVTLLTNYTMPLIRYTIEDRGIFSKKVCSCGRGFPMLEKVEGRIRNMFRNKQGDLIDSGFFISLIYFRDYVKKLQIIQKKVNYIIINLVLKDNQKIQDVKKDFKNINEKIRLVMGNETKIKYNIVDEIKSSKAGKYMYAFSRVKK
jgi:phenylacetate-CoA ligase